MNNENIVKVETIEELAIKLPEGFAEVGEKLHFDVREDGSISISKFVPVEIDIPNELFLELAIMAHEQDITFNELCCNILREKINVDNI